MTITTPLTNLAASQPSTSHYRPDIDGLRAVAVLVVVGYHAFPHLLPGGYIGVDIFFVISGFLITDIIFRKMLDGSFTIADFYQRRVRRIFPALILVTFVTFVIGWFYLPPRDLQSLGTNIAGGAIFMQNIVLLGQVGYFDLAAARKPLLHLWSLGIEEQYYIAWPLVLLAIRRWGLNAATFTFILIGASFWFDLATMKKSVDLAFYLPFTRAWELLIGSALSIWLITVKDVPIAAQLTAQCRRLSDRVESGLQQIVWAPGAPRQGSLVQGLFATAAIIGVLVAVYRFSSTTPYPGTYTLVPVIAAVVLLMTSESWINRTLLSSPPMVFVGLISYPLYLWHYPLIAYAHIMWADGVPARVMAAAIVASFILAWLTYRFVERPIRYSKPRGRTQMAALLAGMVAVGVVGLVADKTGGLPIRIPAEIRSFMLTGAETSGNWRSGKCLMGPEQSPDEFAGECSGDGRRPLVFLWGDSYAASLYPGLLHFADKRGFGVAEYTASACAPMVDYVNGQRRFCKPANDFTMKKINELRPEVIVLYSTWSYGAPDLENGLQKTVRQLKAWNIKKIVLLGPPGTWLGDGLAANVLDYYYTNGSRSLLPARTTYRSNEAWTRPLDEFLQKQAEDNGIDYISARKIMCNGDGCLARIGPDGSQLTAYDNGHLTLPGSIFLAGSIIDRLLETK